MIRKAVDLNVTINENMRGGKGNIVIKHLADKAEMYEKSRLFAKIIINPGCSIGYHVHKNEMEIFHIVSGCAQYDDNGSKVTLLPGDVTITSAGEGHSIANSGDEDLEIIALIIMQ